MQPLCIKRRAFGDEDYLAIRNEGIDIVRNEGGLIGANSRRPEVTWEAKDFETKR